MANDRTKNKVKATHKPPARVRYEQSHPTLSCRLDKDSHDLLTQRLEDLGGVSFADFVRDALGLLQLRIPETKEIKEKARRAGYNHGQKDHQIWYFCAECGERIAMTPNSDSHKAMISYMRKDGWGHTSCHRQ